MFEHLDLARSGSAQELYVALRMFNLVVFLLQIIYVLRFHVRGQQATDLCISCVFIVNDICLSTESYQVAAN